MEVFDKAKYHADGDFPSGLPREQAYLPGGMFIAWCALADLLSEEIRHQFSAECIVLNDRTSSPCSLYRAFGGVFTDAHLSRQGIDFAKAYFDLEHGDYLDDYIDVLANEVPTAYHVADSWQNFDLLRSVLDRRYSDWKGH